MTDTAPSPLPRVSKQLIVFDFDWSLADQDTDRWVHECLAPELRAKLKTMMHSVQFTDLCAQLLVELYQQGKTKQQIIDAMKTLPFHPGMKRGVEQLKHYTPSKEEEVKTETTFFLLSNSNQVYIDIILQHQGLQDIFTEIVTNPAEWSEKGCLILHRRILKDSVNQHSCSVGCSPNMCKGEELESFLQRHDESFQRIIYVGDGANDYCPILRLGSKDLALVRRHRGLEKRIAKEAGVKAGIRYWSGAWEMEGILGELRGLPRLEY